MMDESVTPAWEQLEVIGTTTPARAGDHPCKMAPIYRDRLDPGRYFLPHAEDAEGGIRLSPVEKWWIDDQIALGEVTIFSHAIQAQAGHCLLQMSADANPEYLPEKDAPARARKACREALLLASEALRRYERADAERWAWYALRADRDQDPLPLLALIALLRLRGNNEEACMLEGDLGEFADEAQIAASKARLRADPSLGGIQELLDRDPVTPPGKPTSFQRRRKAMERSQEMLRSLRKAAA